MSRNDKKKGSNDRLQIGSHKSYDVYVGNPDKAVRDFGLANGSFFQCLVYCFVASGSDKLLANEKEVKETHICIIIGVMYTKLRHFK